MIQLINEPFTFTPSLVNVICHLNFKICGHNSVVLLCYFFLRILTEIKLVFVIFLVSNIQG